MQKYHFCLPIYYIEPDASLQKNCAEKISSRHTNLCIYIELKSIFSRCTTVQEGKTIRVSENEGSDHRHHAVGALRRLSHVRERRKDVCE